jgi:CheY-like chemotaxis protein
MEAIVKVLIVDDSTPVRRVLKRLLAKAGLRDAEFYEAADGVEGLAVAGRLGVSCDLVITDLNMPHMDGSQLIAALRASAATCRVPILVITGETEREHAEGAVATGANAYVLKPFTARALRTRLDALLTGEAAAPAAAPQGPKEGW